MEIFNCFYFERQKHIKGTVSRDGGWGKALEWYHGREKYSASPPKSIKLWNIRTFDKIVIETFHFLHLNQNGPNYEI
jgi:hypothetical protein